MFRPAESASCLLQACRLPISVDFGCCSTQRVCKNSSVCALSCILLEPYRTKQKWFTKTQLAGTVFVYLITTIQDVMDLCGRLGINGNLTCNSARENVFFVTKNLSYSIVLLKNEQCNRVSISKRNCGLLLTTFKHVI